MIAHLFRIIAATGCILLGALLPSLPGRYDSLAVPLSITAQLIGYAGLLLVPVGILWTAAEYGSMLRPTRYAFAVTALIVSCVVWLLVSLAVSLESLTFGLGALSLGAYVVVRLLPRLRRLKGATARPGSPTAVYLSIVPLAVAAGQLALAAPVTDFSRSRAIRNSARLIADIEAYRAANGRYPLSTLSMWPDYKPSIIGIKEYRYELSGDAYNLMFEQPSLRLGTREMVMYNPTDQQAIASHALDVLQLTPGQLARDRTRGHYAVHDAGHAHWKYFLFD
jgi:hypothetical protein